MSYRLFGENTGSCVVIESAMAASCAEWWHLAEKWSAKLPVLVYDRYGYGQSSPTKKERTPEIIAGELDELLCALGIMKVILIGHSIGGVYAYQFARLFPAKIISLILLDPVSPDNSRFKRELTADEFAKSGVDKSMNLKLGQTLCSLGLGFVLKPLLKKAPPFYYYKNFSREAEAYILKNQTNAGMYKTAIKEYSVLDNGGIMSGLRIEAGSMNMPLFLICHTPEVMKNEIEYYGNAGAETAEKIESLWSVLMKQYLSISDNSLFIQAKNSGHMIHLTDPDAIESAIEQSLKAATV